MNRSFLTLLFLFTLFPAPSFAYRNTEVVQEAYVYRAIERLVSLGLIDKIIVGHKPWSALEVARLIDEAQNNLGRLHNIELEIEAKQTLKRLEALKFKAVTAAGFDYFFLDSPPREIPFDVGTGDTLQASTNPLAGGRSGANFSDTHNFRLEAAHQLDWRGAVSVVGRPYFLLRQKSKEGWDPRFGFDQFYLRGEIWNVGLQIGRDALLWGPSRNGGVFHSPNATPPDMAKISNIHPFYYPWILKYLGPSQASFFFSSLEGNRDFPHAYMTGWKLSFEPHRNFEFGLTYEIMAGGEGSGAASFATRVADTLGFFSSLSDRDPHISNRVGGFDFTWRIPKWRGLTFYYEGLMEDTQSPSHFDIMFIDEAIHQFGVFLPRLNNIGTKSLRFEITRSGFRPYRHHQYTSGWTHNRQLIGNDLGPDALRFLAEYESGPTWHFHIRHSLAFEKRDNDQYALLNVATQVRKTADNPGETRLRWMSGLEWRPGDMAEVGLGFGYERVNRFNFTPGLNMNNFLVNFGVTVFPKI